MDYNIRPFSYRFMVLWRQLLYPFNDSIFALTHNATRLTLCGKRTKREKTTTKTSQSDDACSWMQICCANEKEINIFVDDFFFSEIKLIGTQAHKCGITRQQRTRRSQANWKLKWSQLWSGHIRIKLYFFYDLTVTEDDVDERLRLERSFFHKNIIIYF